MSKALVIFTGHNDRAVVALARAMESRRIPFFLVPNETDTLADQLVHASQIPYRRRDSSVTIGLFENIRSATPFDGPLVYCPTTEFINHFVLSNRKRVQDAGFDIPLPDERLYATLTSKYESADLIRQHCGAEPPPILHWDQATPPCVFKPKLNIVAGRAQYPHICTTAPEVAEAKHSLSSNTWFAQRLVAGQSYYLCAYITRHGLHASYWQANLLQQPGGKSIVLARDTANPGFDSDRLISALIGMGYFGPFMMELIQAEHSPFYYIEINPRFWGPLQLASSACPRLFDLFAADTGLVSTAHRQDYEPPSTTSWYAWEAGAERQPLKRYPAVEALAEEDIRRLLQCHDVFRTCEVQTADS